ncbi:MAG: hydroxypyruvate isomerase [Gammaproteobacteria bacterium]|jgi:hydroxypyruvate isomerase
MVRLSANLGFLWTELTLPEAIEAAKRAGFVAVECHWPYATDAEEVQAALKKTNLLMLSLNTRRGNVGGDNGVAAIVGREDEARIYIDEAIAYAHAVECPNIHVMAGVTDGGAEAEAVFRDNLLYGCDKAAALDKTILIEPLNYRDAPGYHLSNLDTAQDTLAAVGMPNLKVIFDCYHVQIMQGDIARRLRNNLAHIGHIQIAGVPDRGEPDRGEVNYAQVLPEIDRMGWLGFIGAEYKPRLTTDAGLGWIKSILL